MAEKAGGPALIICREESEIDFDGLEQSLAEKACHIFRQQRVACMEDARSHGYQAHGRGRLEDICECAATKSAQKQIRNPTQTVLRQGNRYMAAMEECGYLDWISEKSGE